MKSLSKMILHDGRCLAFSEYGDPIGKAIFFFHGFPGSRLQAQSFHEFGVKHQYRIFGIDRPGMGASTYRKNQSIINFSQDITQLADHLKLDKFSIIGHSGGTSFLLACAHSIPQRLNGVAIVAGFVPRQILQLNWPERFFNFNIGNLPGFAYTLLSVNQKIMLRQNTMQKHIEKMPEPDRLLLQDPKKLATLMESMQMSFSQGASGPAQEMRMLFKPLEFDLRKINYPITFWHGAHDQQIPVADVKILQSQVSNSKLNVFEDEAHLSLLENRCAEIFASVI